MPYRLSLVLFVIFTLTKAHGQSSGSYTFSLVNSASLSADINGNAINMLSGSTILIGPALDSVFSPSVPIGFDLYFMGSYMSNFSCIENGQIELNKRSLSAGNTQVSGSAVTNILAPFAYNLQTGIDGSVHYKLFGTAPNRLCVIEYRNVMIGYSPGGATSGTATFQVRLYENGTIEYVYGQMATNSSIQPGSTAEIGWMMTNTANKFVSVDSTGNTYVNGNWPVFVLESNSIIAPLHSFSEGSRICYRFTPPQTSVAQPGLPVFTAVSASSMTVNWLDNSTNETNFNVFRSNDNVNFIKVATLTSTSVTSTGTGYSYTASGLIPNLLYYFRIVANSEATPSQAVTGSKLTTPSRAYHWTAAGSAFFGDPSNWNPQRLFPDPTDTLRFDNGVVSTVSFIPTMSVAKIVITNNTKVHFHSSGGAVITINGKTPNALQVTSGSSLLLDGLFPNMVTLGFSPGFGATVTIGGTLELVTGNIFNITGSAVTVSGVLANAGIINGASAASLIFSSTGTYNHKYTQVAGIVPTATWSSGSHCMITGYTLNNYVLSSLVGQTLSNLTWDCPAQVNPISLEANVPIITGTLKIMRGVLWISSNYSPVFNVNNFEQTGGTFELNGGAGSTNMKVSGTFHQTGGIFCPALSGRPILEFTGINGIQNVNFHNAAPQGGVIYRISNPAGINLTGSGGLTTNFAINSYGGIRISTDAAAPINTLFNIIYNNNNTSLTYDAPFGCTMTAVEFPVISGPTNLIINSPRQLFKMPFSRTIHGALIMTGGDIDVGTNSIMLGSSMAAPGGLQWIAGNIRLTTGSMTRWFNTINLPSVPNTGIGFFPISYGPQSRYVSVYGSTQLLSGGSFTVSHSNIPGTTTGLSINDAGYIIQQRTNSSWTFLTNGIVTNGSTVGIRISSGNLLASAQPSRLRLMKETSVIGNNVAGGVTGNIYRVERNALNTQAINSTFYIGASDVDIEPYFVAIQTGNWNDPATWNTGIIPTLNNNASISSGVHVTLNGNSQCKSLTIDPGATLLANVNTLTIDNILNNYGTLNISGGNIVINGPPIVAGQGLTNYGGSAFNLTTGSLTIGPNGGGNKRFNHEGGIAMISDGQMIINGNLVISAGMFSQYGGSILIDGNSGISAATSALNGAHLFSISGGSISFQGGSVTIADPPFRSTVATMAVSVKSPATNASAFGGTHTFIFGDGGTTTGHTTNGFTIETYSPVSGGRIPLNNVVVDGGNATGRFVRNTFNTSNGTHIKGTLTINAGSEYRVQTNTFGRDCYGGNIINNGIFTAAGTIVFGGENNVYTVNSPQTVSGSGTFRNLVSGSTANFTGITLNNSSGITLNTGNVSYSGVLTFTSGNLNTGGDTLIQLMGGSFLGSPGTSSHIIGAFRQYAATGSLVQTYPIGDHSVYTPLILTGSPGAIVDAGFITISTSGTEHPFINNSGISSGKSLNRFFSIRKENNLSILPGSLSIIFNWSFADIDAGANTGNFVAALDSAGLWNVLNVRNKTATSLRAIDLSSVGDFIIGEQCMVSASFNYSNLEYCNTGFTAPIFSQGSSSGTFTSYPTLNIDPSTGIINLTGSQPGLYKVTNTVSIPGCSSVSDTTSILIIGTSAAGVTVSASPNPSCAGKIVTFTATPSNGGVPSFQWKLNGFNTGTNNAEYSSSVLNDGDVVTCIMTSSLGCATGNPATSTPLVLSINPTPSQPVITSAGSTFISCSGTVTLISSYTGMGNVWMPGGVTSDSLVATGGTYTVEYTDANGCSSGPSTPAAITLVSPNIPLSGTYSIGDGQQSCTNYLSFTAAINALNANGVSGPVIFNVPAGYTETAPDNGLQLKMCSLDPGFQSSQLRPIIFQKSGNGNNPVITAGTGSSNADAIVKIIGGDYITFDAIDVRDTSSSTGVLSQMEWGYALLKCDGTNGSQNNIIRNCSISLQRTNQSTAAIYMNNHSGESNIGLTFTGSPGFENDFRNSGNSFYGLTIQNAYTGITLQGSATINDALNRIGNALLPANRILNFGGGVVPSIAISISNQRMITVVNNEISGGDSSTSSVTGIYASAASAITGMIAGNKITLSSSSVSVNGITGISIGSITNGDELTVADNIIENCSFSTGTSAPFNGISSSYSGTGVHNILRNTIRNNNLTTVTNGIFNGINLNGNPAGLFVDSNNILSNRLSGIGAFNAIHVADSLINFRVGWNVISENRKTGTHGTFNGILISSPSDNLVTGNRIISNGLSSTNGAGQNNVAGINHISGSGKETVSETTIHDLFAGGTGTGLVLVSGIRNLNNASLRTISNNSIDSLYSTPNATVIAINSINSGGPFRITNNKIYDIIAGGVNGIATGIFTSNVTSTIHISNNYIGNLYTPFSAGASAVRGMELNGQASTGVYFNTIRLSASSTSNLFGSSGILANFTCPLDMRNNIIINLSIPGGLGGTDGVTAAYRRNSTNLTNYAQTSNRNVFYAGVPGDNNLIYCESLANPVLNARQMLNNYKQLVSPRDNASATEDVAFLSIAGSTTGFLHVNPLTLTVIEGNALTVAGITTDFDGDLRNTLTPDIGADEGGFMGTGPSVSIVTTSPPAGSCIASSHTMNAVVLPGVSPVTSVLLIYSFDSVPQGQLSMINTSGNNWQAVIPPATPFSGIVTWTVVASDGTYSQQLSGSYRDQELTQYNLVTNTFSTPSYVCGPDTIQLSAVVTGYGLAPNNYCTVSHTAASNCITRVKINTLNSITSTQACSLPSFTIFPQSDSSTTSLIAGRSYILSVNTNISSMVWVWIDYNRNAQFESNEGTLLYTSSFGGQTNINIPSTAAIGGTRMRIRSTNSNGSLTSNDACTTMNGGETEDYIINIIPDLNFSWSPSSGLSNPAIANPLAVVNGAASYTVTASDGNGCSAPSLTSTVSINAASIPTAPIGMNSSQCGSGVPDCSVESPGNYYYWYLSPSGGIPLNGEHSDSLIFYSIQATKHFWVSVADSFCESERTEVIAFVTQPDSVKATASTTISCINVPVTLSASHFGSSNTYSYSWSCSQSGSGITGIETGQTINVIPSSPGTFTYNLIAFDSIQNCSAISAVTVTVNTPPSITHVQSPAAIVCPGDSLTLSAYTTINGNAILGIDTIRNSRTDGWPTPYGGYFGGSRSQYLVTAAELEDAGLVAGAITSITFRVTQLSGVSTYNGFTLKMGHTTASSLSSNFHSGPVTQVAGPMNYSPVTGNNKHNFVSPFIWDGISNVLIEICFNNNSNGNINGNVVVNSTTTTFVSAVHYGANQSNSVCTQSLSSGQETKRPNMVFGGKTISNAPGLLTWQWNPGALQGNVVGTTLQSATSFTVTATSLQTSCTNTSTISIGIHPIPPSPVGYDSIHCGAAVPLCYVSGGNSFRWYGPAGLIAGETDSVLSTFLCAATTIFSVTAFDGTCESNPVQVTETVSHVDSISIITGDSACLNTPIQLTAIQHGNINSFDYEWTSDTAAGSGISAPLTGQSVNVTPTINGLHTYTITASDLNCKNIASVTLDVKNNPVVSTISTNLQVACSGEPIELSATSFELTGNVAKIGTGTVTNSVTTYPTPYGHAFGGAKEQYLVLASELSASGLQPGDIHSLGFDVVTLPSVGGNLLQNFSISIGSTNLVSLPSSIQYGINGMTTLFYSNYIITTGINTHSFTSPFHWDGTSNLLIEVCFNNNDTGAVSGGNAVVRQMLTGFASTIEYHRSSSPTVCMNAGSSTITGYFQRPVLYLGGETGIDQTATLNWNWTPGNLSGNNATATSNQAGINTFTVTATDTNGCTASSDVSLFVNPISPAPLSHDSSHCGTSVPLCSVNSGGFLRWYLIPVGGLHLAGENGPSLQHTTASVTTTYYVSDFDGVCESARTAVTETVYPADSVYISLPSVTICRGTPFILTANQVGSVNQYSFNWDSDPGGGLNQFTGSQVNATATTAGLLRYTVTATDGICSWVAPIDIISNIAPSVTASSQSNTLCHGATGQLSALGKLSGNSIQLNGIDQYVSIPASTSLDIDRNFTLEAWINPLTLANGNGIISKNQSFVTGGYSLHLTYNGNDAGIELGGNNLITAPPGVLIPGEWSHVAAVFSGNSGNNNYVILYVNGVAVASGITTVSINSDSLRMGVNFGGKYFGGEIDEVRIWRTTLSQATIQSWMNKPLSNLHPSFSNLAAYYDFNTLGPVIPDESGNGNSGVVVNNGLLIPSTAPLTDGFSYSWTPAATLDSAFIRNPSATPPLTGSNTYTVTATANNGCIATASATINSVTSHQAPFIFVANNLTVFCNSGSNTLVLQNPRSGSQIQWQSSTDNISWNDIPNENSISLSTGTLTTTRYYRVVVICAVSDTSNVITITINTPSITSVTGATRCGPGVVNLSVTGTGTFDWYSNSTTGVPLFSGANFQPTINVNVTYWVEARIGTCLFTGNRQPVLAALTSSPAVSASSNSSSVCAGSSVTLSAVSSHDPNYSYVWSPGNISGDSVSVSPSSTTIYTVTATDTTTGTLNGCAATSTISITVLPLPVAPIVSPASPMICTAGGSVTMSVSNITPSTAYRWNPGNLLGVSVTVSPVSTTTYTVTAIRSTGCTNNTTFTVIYAPIISPTISMTGPDSVCQGNSDTLSVNGIYSQYNWSVAGNILGTNSSIVVAPSSSTVYTVTVSNDTCSSTASQLITVFPFTPLSISTSTGDSSFCSGDSLMVSANAGYSDYLWTESGNIAGTSGALNVTSGGLYRINVSGSNGCSDSAEINISVKPSPPVPVIFPTGPLTICDDGSDSPITLWIDSTGGGANSNLFWNDVGASSGPTLNIRYDDIDFISNGNTYSYYAILSNSSGCSQNSNSVTIDVVNCQSTSSLVNVKMFIEGFYYSGQNSLMNNSGNGGRLFITGNSTDMTDADTVTISLMDALDYHLVETNKGILKTNGYVTVAFSNITAGQSYYLRITHRSAIETWSAMPVLLSGSLTTYDFTTSQNQAFGNNMVITSDQLYWAFYSGDISDAVTALPGIQDGVIESQDFVDMENALAIIAHGYIVEDITGDGICESLDYIILENNAVFTITAIRP